MPEEKNLETIDIKDQEVFAVGTWNGDTYTENDLDDMVQAFNLTKDKYKPFLKLGHNDDQHLLINEGLPAAGWIENLRRVGDKLVCDFCRVPKKIAELLNVGAWRQKSAEIYWSIKVGNETYAKMLRAVALLGSDMPAVADLNDIVEMYGLKAEASNASFRAYEVEEKNKEGDNAMEIEELKSKLAETEKAHEAMKSEFSAKETGYADEKAKMEASIKELSEKVEKAETEKRKSEIAAYTDKLIADKKILPAHKESVAALLESITTGARTYSDKPVVDIFKGFLEALEVKLPGGTETETDKGGKEQDVHALATRYAAENKVSFKVALKAVSKK